MPPLARVWAGVRPKFGSLVEFKNGECSGAFGLAARVGEMGSRISGRNKERSGAAVLNSIKGALLGERKSGRVWRRSLQGEAKAGESWRRGNVFQPHAVLAQPKAKLVERWRRKAGMGRAAWASGESVNFKASSVRGFEVRSLCATGVLVYRPILRGGNRLGVVADSPILCGGD